MIESKHISVVMPVYNGEKYIKKSIESILNQTYSNLELIIVNDFSNDSTLEIILQFIKKDHRIKLISNDRNLGLTKSLIKAIKLSKGEIIMRQDVDECSDIYRIEKQLKIMNKNNNVILVGSNCINVYPDGSKTIWGFFSDNKISKMIKHRTPFAHGSTMFLRDKYDFVGGYNENYHQAQDFDLWIKFSKIGKISMSNEFLLERYIDENSISEKKKFKQFMNIIKIKFYHTEKFFDLLIIFFSSLYYFSVMLIPKKIFFFFLKKKNKKLI